MPADRRRAARARIRRARLRSLAPLLVVLGVLAAGAIVAIPLGGWDEVELESARVPRLEPGETFLGTRYAVAIHSLTLTDDHPDGFSEREPGQTWLIVETTFENRLEFPQRATGSSDFPPFSIDGVDMTGTFVDTVLDRDGSYGPTLNPGLAEDVTFVLPVPAGRYSDGDVVEVGVWDADRQRAELYSGIRWWQPHVAVEVPVELDDAR